VARFWPSPAAAGWVHVPVCRSEPLSLRHGRHQEPQLRESHLTLTVLLPLASTAPSQFTRAIIYLFVGPAPTEEQNEKVVRLRVEGGGPGEPGLP
jgi:hypothetical protein